MARFLFVVPPLTGHMNPTISVAHCLHQRGHEVAWLGHIGAVGHLVPDWGRLIPFHRVGVTDWVQRVMDRSNQVRGLESVPFLFEEFVIPLAHRCLEEVEHHVEAFRPDCLIVDQQALAGAVVARQKGLPWISFATTPASILKVWEVADRWVERVLDSFQQDLLLEPVARPDLSPHGTVVFTTEAFLGDTPRIETAGAGPYHFVGPCFQAREDNTPFPWDQLDDTRPKLLISLGTVNRDRDPRFYKVMMEALADAPIQAIMVASQEQAPNPPTNFIVRERVPQVALLPHLQAVLCHAGHNTVCESLAHGVPLIVTPIRDDQPVIARQVTANGCGLGLRFGKLKPAKVRETVERVLSEPAFAEAAARIRQSLAAAGGAAAAADALEALARQPLTT